MLRHPISRFLLLLAGVLMAATGVRLVLERELSLQAATTELGLLAVLLAALLFFGRAFLLVPLRRLLGKAEQALEQDPVGRVAWTGEDELAHIADSFNRMSERVRASRTEAERAREETRRMGEDLSRKDRHTVLAHDAVKAFASHLDFEELCQEAISTFIRTFRAERVALVAIHEGSRTVSVSVEDTLRRAGSTTRRKPATLPRDQAGLTELARDWHEMRVALGWMEALETSVVQEDLATMGHYSGFAGCCRPGTWPFAESDERLFELLVSDFCVALENARLYELAIKDGLTGLYTRRYFEQRLDEALALAARRGGVLSLIMVDVNHFKLVNDQLGHLKGDEVLMKVAETLAASLRSTDLPVRYGGDEFSAILMDTDIMGAEEVAIRLTLSFARRADLPLLADGKTVSLSVGIATYPEHATERNDLIYAADNAMYSIKALRDNRYAIAPKPKKAKTGT